MFWGRYPAVFVGGTFLLGLALVACGGDAGKVSRKNESTPTTRQMDFSDAGTVMGLLKFGGPVVTRRKLDTSRDRWCAKHPQLLDEELVVGDSGGLRDVFIYVEGLDLIANQFPEPDRPARITQKDCQFVPHVLGVCVDQEVEIVNEDDTSHNYHFMGQANAEINRTQVKPMTNIEIFDTAELSLSLVCDIHAWMKATLHVMKHPCFAVSAADGSFRIKGIPPGTYKLRFLHAHAQTSQDGMSIVVLPRGKLDIGTLILD